MTITYRRLGKGGLEVSSLCLGAMMFGDQADEAEADRIVQRARDAGINFIDTADAYGGGRSEEIVGKTVRSHRDWWIVATKVGTRLPPFAPNRGGNGRSWILRGVEESLARLKTGYIDLYYLHLDDLATPLEETVEAMGTLVREGKIRHWGVSNFRALAHCRADTALRSRRRSPADRRTALLQCGQPDARSRVSAALRAPRHRRRAL